MMKRWISYCVERFGLYGIRNGSLRQGSFWETYLEQKSASHSINCRLPCQKNSHHFYLHFMWEQQRFLKRQK